MAAVLAGALGGVGEPGPMVHLGAVAELRWGEVAGLRARDVDVSARTLTVALGDAAARAVGAKFFGPGRDGRAMGSGG